MNQELLKDDSERAICNYGSIADSHTTTTTTTDIDFLQASGQPGYGTLSVFKVSLNIVNATVGSGVIGLPFALVLSGFTMGIAISVWVCVLSCFAVYLLVFTGQKVGIFNFASLAQVAMGQIGFHLLNLMLFIQSAGSVISYFILVGDTIPVILGRYFPQYSYLANRQLVTILVSVIIIFPLNLFRSIGALASWSAFSVFLLPVMIISVLIRAPYYAKDHEAPLLTIGSDPIATMGIMSFAFVCSQVVFSNYLSQKNQSLGSWKITSYLSTFISWFVSIAFAAIGYLSFGKDATSNIFSSFPADDHVINVGRFALGLSMVLTVPMAFFPARDAIQKTIGFETIGHQPTPMQHYSVTVILFAVFLILGIQINSLGKVYSVVGGVASSFLAYIIPGFAYIAVFHPTWVFKQQDSSLIISKTKSVWWLDIIAVILVLFGIAVMLYTIFHSVI
ncbi:transmembrane amino acid transporter protein-domain-containing protein [Cokeromyces recurvatus]|uniref:transmembrane amino acid transporter protein-domain-containing protein n=1 Tax=Cokeromyces recurvatus TaxID=90255 RepID=UPI00221FF50A|nr:transmembrane amino acid transporter protein-domain-containing protein [Cokeromyces recurvatus]KAI7903321.1 transmembrane amino acid transporter protein-domain-containing protein [Cokeromyces recurvatus]